MPFIGIFSSSSNPVVSKFQRKIDDALDVFACHGVGGMTGTDGCLASKAVNSAVTDQGLIFGETLFIHQLTAMIIVSIFAFSASYFLFFVVNKINDKRR
jgi:Amt family ammonium transporter